MGKAVISLLFLLSVIFVYKSYNKLSKAGTHSQLPAVCGETEEAYSLKLIELTIRFLEPFRNAGCFIESARMRIRVTIWQQKSVINYNLYLLALIIW